MIAAALQRKCSLNWGTFTLFPNMYIVLVGPSGCRKGTAMGPGFSFIRKLGLRMAAEATTREALIKALKDCNDNTVIKDVVHIHSSLTIFSQELTVFLGYNNQQLMADLCDWFDCRDLWVYRTKNMGTDEIHGVWVNLIGATTPDLLASTLPQDAIGGGLTARMIMIYETQKGKIVPLPRVTEEELTLAELLQSDLEKINLMGGEFQPTEDFINYWVEWYVYQSHNPPFDHPKFGGYLERRGMHVLKLSMICSASESNDMLITEKHLKRAIGLLELVENKMIRVFDGVGASPVSAILTSVLHYIATVKVCKLTDLMSRFYQDVDKRGMIAMLDTLATAGSIRVVNVPNDLKIYYKEVDNECELEESRGVAKLVE